MLLTIFSCLLLTQSFGQTSSVTGYVLDMTTEEPLAGTKVDLHSVPDNAGIATAITDSSGHFAFQNIKAGNYFLSCFYKMTTERKYLQEVAAILGRSDIDSSFILSSGHTYRHTFHLLVYCPYEKTKDLFVCPQCRKSDRVQSIFWGLPVYDINGRSNVPDNSYLAGCSPDEWCNPTKHCKRCDINF